MKYKLFVLWILPVSLAMGQASTLTVLTKTDQDIAIPIDEINKLFFTKNQTGAVWIGQTDGTVNKSVLTEIEKITFGELSRVETGESKHEHLDTFFLSRNYPNPFNPSTTIEFTLFEPNWTSVTIVNIQGRVVRHLIDGYFAAGLQHVVWDAKNDADQTVSSGVYFYKVSAGRSDQMKKCLFIE